MTTSIKGGFNKRGRTFQQTYHELGLHGPLARLLGDCVDCVVAHMHDAILNERWVVVDCSVAHHEIVLL